MRIYMQLVGVCVCACVWLSALDNFKTIADNCFLFGSYVYWGNAWTIKSSHVKIIGKVKVIFFHRVQEVYDFLLDVAVHD